MEELPKLPPGWFATPEGRQYWNPVLQEMMRREKEARDRAKRYAEFLIYSRGVEAAIKIIEERGQKIRGAIQPGRTIQQIREKLLNFVE